LIEIGLSFEFVQLLLPVHLIDLRVVPLMVVMGPYLGFQSVVLLLYR
jgi:hypothetical protein